MEYSNEEAEQSDQESSHNNNVGIGRFYECVYCKRGFTTAQALGGHMNIHRKDRAKSTKPSSNKHDPRFYHHQPISSSSNYYAASNESHQSSNYRTFFPGSTSSSSTVARQLFNHDDDNQQRFDCYGDDWRMSLSLQYNSTLLEDHMKKNKPGEIRENDIDLELRLGPDP